MQAKLSISLDVADFRKRSHSSFSLLIDRDALSDSLTNENRTRKLSITEFLKSCMREREEEEEGIQLRYYIQIDKSD